MRRTRITELLTEKENHDSMPELQLTSVLSWPSCAFRKEGADADGCVK